MDKERGLIAGIDLSGTRIQASVYSQCPVCKAYRRFA